MLEHMIDSPELNKYLMTFKAGQTILLEGDDSQDLYILVSGEVDVIKGLRKITEISKKGTAFGEISFLLGEKRTATVKAKDDVKVICIPKEKVPVILKESPDLLKELARFLARRLDETSQVLFGLKELCDQLPDAVVLSDRDGKILSWNTAAEKLYGREENQMRYSSAGEIYEDPEIYKSFLEEVKSRYSVKEKILRVRHPDRGIRHISTSTTVLYDGQHNFQGVLSLGRDVTAVKTLERRYRRTRHWCIPLFVLLGLFAAGFFYGYPYFSQGYKALDARKQELRDDLAINYRLLKSLLTDAFEGRARSETSQVLKGFFDVQKGITIPYTGVVLLDKGRRVLDAYSIKPGTDTEGMVGSSYVGIDFEGSERSPHRVLTVYRTDKDHPMGHKGLELAFEVRKNNELLGWVVFQMDVDLLERKYGIDEEGLKKFHFERSQPG